MKRKIVLFLNVLVLFIQFNSQAITFSRESRPQYFKGECFDGAEKGFSVEAITQTVNEFKKIEKRYKKDVLHLAATGGKGGGNSSELNLLGCAEDYVKDKNSISIQDKIMTIDELITYTGIEDDLRFYLKEAKNVFDIDLENDLRETLFCRTETPLEQYLNTNPDPTRNFVWLESHRKAKPQIELPEMDTIMWNELPSSKELSDVEKKKIAFDLVKEMFSNHVSAKSVHTISAKVEPLMKRFKEYLAGDVSKTELKAHAIAFGIHSKK